MARTIRDVPAASGRRLGDGPTARQVFMLRMIHEHTVMHGRAPTLREIGSALGIRSTNAIDSYLVALKTWGCVMRAERSRGLRVTPFGLQCIGHIDPIAACLRAIYQSPS